MVGNGGFRRLHPPYGFSFSLEAAKKFSSRQRPRDNSNDLHSSAFFPKSRSPTPGNVQVVMMVFWQPSSIAYLASNLSNCYAEESDDDAARPTDNQMAHL